MVRTTVVVCSAEHGIDKLRNVANAVGTTCPQSSSMMAADPYTKKKMWYVAEGWLHVCRKEEGRMRAVSWRINSE